MCSLILGIDFFTVATACYNYNEAYKSLHDIAVEVQPELVAGSILITNLKVGTHSFYSPP